MRATLSLKDALRRAWQLWRYGDTVAFSGADGPQKLIDMYIKHGPLTVMVDTDDDADWFPEGRVLEGVKIKKVHFFDEGDGGIASIDVEWETDRPVRTGVMSWFLGP